MAAIVIVIVFPVGSMLMRIVPGRFTVLIHAIVQILGYVSFAAAVGLGIYLTQYVNIPSAGGSLVRTYPQEKTTLISTWLISQSCQTRT
jgi:hypothetical protein